MHRAVNMLVIVSTNDLKSGLYAIIIQFQVNGIAKKRFIKGEKEDENTDVQEDEAGVSSEVHFTGNPLNGGKVSIFWN